MKSIIGLILLVLGIVVFVMGYNRKNSVVGGMADAGTSVANTVDGGVRQPEHTMYMIAGGVMFVVGAGVLASARRSRALPSTRA